MVGPPPPGTRIDRYEVEQLVAAGGAGLVLRVRHVHLGTVHALKLLHTGSEAWRRRLWREGRIQAALRHPNLVAVTDVVAVDDDVGLVMDLVAGPDLGEWARRHRASVEEVDALAEQLFAAVACAHAARVVHRDLKPDNVLVERVGDGLRLRVADFGLAVALAEEGPRVTQTGQALGTPRYMAPEQYRDGGAVDHRADLFALGAVLYELLAGRPAFDEITVLSAFEAAASARFPSLAELVPAVPPRMVRAVEAALRPDPEDRPASVEVLRELWRGGSPAPEVAWSPRALEAAVPAPDRPTPVIAPTLPLPERAPAPPRRLLPALLVGLGGAVAFALVVGLPPPPPAPAEATAPLAAAPPAPEPPPAVPEESPPAEAASSVASLTVKGVRRARLVDAAGHAWAPAADLAPGAYQLEVWFDEDAPTRVLALQLRAGSSRVVRCSRALRVCQ